MSEPDPLLPRFTARGIGIGVAVLAGCIALSVGIGNYWTAAPHPPIQLASAVDGCDRFWALMNSDKSIQERRAEVSALAGGFEPFDEAQAERLRFLALEGPDLGRGKPANRVFERCVNQHDWPPPTEEIAAMREPQGRSDN